MIRLATSSDLDNLQTLHNKVILDMVKFGTPAYDAAIQKSGFLLGTDEPNSLANDLENGYKFLVYEENGKILGYLNADHRMEQRFYDDEYKTWFNTELRDFYYQSPKGMSIATVAVDPDSSVCGIATSLLNELESYLKKDGYEYLFSIVVLAPLTNCASILWHTKNGFKRLGMGRPRRLFELDNFASVLLYKKLEVI